MPPAGTPFVHEGRLYRPAQDNRWTQGDAVALNVVRRLRSTDFDEEVVKEVEPHPDGPYSHGLHTISAVDGVALIDAKRVVFDWHEFQRELRARIRGARRN